MVLLPGKCPQEQYLAISSLKEVVLSKVGGRDSQVVLSIVKEEQGP